MAKEQSLFVSFMKYILLPMAIVIIIRSFLFSPIVVDGASMSPTLTDEDKIIINKVSSYDRFDVIVFRGENGNLYVKRIIGVEGDQITYQNDQLYINGELFEEVYLDALELNIAPLKINHTGSFTLKDLYGVETVPKTSYFVLGDNRVDSMDSRNPYTIGLVTEEQILGEVEFVYFPFSNLHWVK